MTPPLSDPCSNMYNSVDEFKVWCSMNMTFLSPNLQAQKLFQFKVQYSSILFVSHHSQDFLIVWLSFNKPLKAPHIYLKL